jgi:DNA-binding NarL/FixJ family response regulator
MVSMTYLETRDADLPMAQFTPGQAPKSHAYSGDAVRLGSAMIICPSLLVREGMVRMLERFGGGRAFYAASSMESGVNLNRVVRPHFTWVHEQADLEFSFVRMFMEHRRSSLIAVLLEPGEQAGERANLAFQAGAFAVFDASSPADQLLDGLRMALQGKSYLSPTLRRHHSTAKASGTSRRGILTGREYQVLQLMAEGLQNQEIADTLLISVETVRSHTKSTMRKLNAQSRAEAVSRAFRMRILVPENFSAIAPPALVARARRRAG